MRSDGAGMSASQGARGLDPDALARKARAGSSAAYDRLTKLFEAQLYAFISMMIQDEAEAEDVTQEALLRAWQNLERYDVRRKFSTWLFTIARRCAWLAT